MPTRSPKPAKLWPTESTWWPSGFGMVTSRYGEELGRSIGLHDRAIRYLMPLPEVVRLVDFVIVIRSHFALSTDALTPANRLGYKPAGRAIMPRTTSGARGVSRGILSFCLEIHDEASRVSCPGERCDIGTRVARRSVKTRRTLRVATGVGLPFTAGGNIGKGSAGFRVARSLSGRRTRRSPR